MIKNKMTKATEMKNINNSSNSSEVNNITTSCKDKNKETKDINLKIKVKRAEINKCQLEIKTLGNLKAT